MTNPSVNSLTTGALDSAHISLLAEAGGQLQHLHTVHVVSTLSGHLTQPTSDLTWGTSVRPFSVKRKLPFVISKRQKHGERLAAYQARGKQPTEKHRERHVDRLHGRKKTAVTNDISFHARVGRFSPFLYLRSVAIAVILFWLQLVVLVFPCFLGSRIPRDYRFPPAPLFLCSERKPS